jgi:hypothetical protein
MARKREDRSREGTRSCLILIGPDCTADKAIISRATVRRSTAKPQNPRANCGFYCNLPASNWPQNAFVSSQNAIICYQFIAICDTLATFRIPVILTEYELISVIITSRPVGESVTHFMPSWHAIGLRWASGMKNVLQKKEGRKLRIAPHAWQADPPILVPIFRTRTANRRIPILMLANQFRRKSKLSPHSCFQTRPK